MLNIIIKIFGYYTVYFLVIRFKNSIKRQLKESPDNKVNDIVGCSIVFVPALTFVIYQLVVMGLRF